MSTVQPLSNEYLKGVMVDAMVGRNQAVDFNQFIPGIFYVVSATLNNPWVGSNGVLENVSVGPGTPIIGFQRFTTRSASGNTRVFVRSCWLDEWTAWGMIQFSPFST